MSGLRYAWVAPLSFAVHALNVNPARLGLWGDEAIYLSLARSWGGEEGPVAACLPGSPAVTKYPWGFPALLRGLQELGVAETTLPIVQVALWALVAQVVVSGLLPRLGASPTVRVGTGLLLAVNGVTWQLAPQVMSEPAFTLLLVGACAILARQAPSRSALVGLAVLVFVGSSLRGVGGLYALAGAGVALWSRRFGVAAALAAGASLAGAGSFWSPPGTAGVSPELAELLAYYISYDVHVGWYGELAAEGGLVGLVRGLIQVAGANARLAPLSLGQFLSPESMLDEAGGPGAGVSALGGIFAALAAWGAWRCSRPVGVLLAAHVCIFLFWTWPFAIRFWLPLWGLLVPMALLGLERLPAKLERGGKLAVWPVIGVLLVGSGIAPAYAALARLSSPTHAAPDRLDRSVAAARAFLLPGDVVVGEAWVFWLLRGTQAQAVEAQLLVPFRDVLSDLLRLAPAHAERPRRAALFRESLFTLRRATAPENTVWVAIDPDRADPKRAWVADAERFGTLERAAEFESLWLWRVGGAGGSAKP